MEGYIQMRKFGLICASVVLVSCFSWDRQHYVSPVVVVRGGGDGEAIVVRAGHETFDRSAFTGMGADRSVDVMTQAGDRGGLRYRETITQSRPEYRQADMARDILRHGMWAFALSGMIGDTMSFASDAMSTAFEGLTELRETDAEKEVDLATIKADAEK